MVTLLHAFSLSTTDLASRSGQVRVLVEGGELVGALFAGLLGAMSLTGEFRHGTIRPTFLVTPRRGRVIAAKTVSNALGPCTSSRESGIPKACAARPISLTMGDAMSGSWT